ncbi:MAG: hypothetical protein ACLVAW_17985 [Eisenbergiella massiliensis]
MPNIFPMEADLFYFEIEAERNREKFIDNLQLFSLLANVADVKSLVSTRPPPPMDS